MASHPCSAVGRVCFSEHSNRSPQSSWLWGTCLGTWAHLKTVWWQEGWNKVTKIVWTTCCILVSCVWNQLYLKNDMEVGKRWLSQRKMKVSVSQKDGEDFRQHVFLLLQSHTEVPLLSTFLWHLCFCFSALKMPSNCMTSQDLESASFFLQSWRAHLYSVVSLHR